METIVTRQVRHAVQLMQRLGPYLLLEIVLPGGTLFALALYAYRRGVFNVANPGRGYDGLEPLAMAPGG